MDILSKQQLMDAVDSSLDIHEKDVAVILSMINNMESKLFIAVIEEIIKGNLSFCDFERVYTGTEYADLLTTSFAKQDAIKTEYTNLLAFRKEIGKDTSDYNVTNNIGFSDVSFSDEEATELDTLKENALFSGYTFNEIKENYDTELAKDEPDEDVCELYSEYIALQNSCDQHKFYQIEYAYTRDNLLDSLTSVKSSDSELTKACKKRLYTAIKNGRIIIANPDKLDDDTGLVKEDSSIEYINPNDMIFSADKFILPIDSTKQVLDNNDINFMKEHNITESEVKKLKAVSMFVKRSEYFIEKDKE